MDTSQFSGGGNPLARHCERCTKLCDVFMNNEEWYCPHCHISYKMTAEDLQKIKGEKNG